jgi:hypothetical protein
VSLSVLRRIWVEIGPRWTPIDAGFINPKLEAYRAERAEYVATQIRKGRAGADKRWHNPGSDADHRTGDSTGHRNGNNNGNTSGTPRPSPNDGSSSSSSSSAPEDQEQDQEQAPDPAPFRTLERIAWEVFDKGNYTSTNADFKEALKVAIAKSREPYAQDLIQRLLDSMDFKLRRGRRTQGERTRRASR